ncbi:hypothetical protein [Geothermobacter hydrogeniphilus]|uniref:hypothetical protein n=1 Tax=Geothermobacter hydrogeniphilus TaxID=1969733 RepID=UPI001551790A|nr:hypothetical protein [Geothermobacter hydrogeniphilus]
MNCKKLTIQDLTPAFCVSPEGEAKFWIEPAMALADDVYLNKRQLLRRQKIVEKK